MLHSASQTKFSVFQVYSSQQELIVMKLVVLTTALLLCAVLQATTVTAAPSDERGKNFSCFYMLLYPCSFYLSCFMHNTVQAAQCPDFCRFIPLFIRSATGCGGCGLVQTQRKPGTLFNCFYMLLYPCTFYTSRGIMPIHRTGTVLLYSRAGPA